MTNLQIVKNYVSKEYFYDGTDPLEVVEITEIETANERGALPGDFQIEDEFTGQIVRVVDNSVEIIWRNW